MADALLGVSSGMPLTGLACIKRIATNLACLEIVKDGFLLLERVLGISVKEIVAATQGNLIVPDQVPEMNF